MLLIGNWRAGLIVASVIPLALLFAVSMMRLFGVSGNLMSLGAIDFGLIVDGAVIIVEAIVHRLQGKPDGTALTANQMDDEVYGATSKMRTSAAFGEIIILIVYLPILALVGIEGKMFTPMAQTVSFAILGAFILSLTYVPMMSALVLSKKLNNKKNLSDKIIAGIQSIYSPVLNAVFKAKALVVTLTIILFGLTLWLFNTMGGEFIPTLSEGDIATHIIIPPGSSLKQEIATTTKAEKLILDNFPEIEQIVSKIGSAEVPTDPMPMEVADMMIIMKEKPEWTSASSKEEMFEKMDAVLDDLPGVTTEFTQPIQMRFNELMTGIRSDVGVKIFGEDIERLVALGEHTESIIHSITGVQDARAESVSGLPQINVNYDKEKIALYGLNIKDLNQAVSMGFAGASAGVVYEGEKKYNMVVRLAKPFRQDITHIENLYVPLPSGNQIPLSQVADIKLEEGPAQISRENGKRRIIVGFNVRGRDVESVVEEIQTRLSSELNLPVGYYTEFAGQFENLKRAKSRLAVAVPIALALIFILLYFTFYSIKQSILIFTAIPLSAIGGVFALWIRDMPFSISAGVGFIALFGVAVLNGIVLIGYFNQLKEEGMTNIMDRIIKGTSVRLRPVIMTASVASLGFLPMALSTSAGAEVQKPLATVVIGGLLTATLLTLIILPILYYYLEKGATLKSKSIKTIGVILISFVGMNSNAQITNIDKAIELVLSNNKSIEASALRIKQSQQLIDGAYIIPKTDFGASFGQMNTKSFDMSYSISQRFNPFVKNAKKTLAREIYTKSEIAHELAKQELILRIRDTWNELQYEHVSLGLLSEQILHWNSFSAYADKKFQVGESNFVEKSTAEIKLQSLKQKILLLQVEVENLQLELGVLLNTGQEIDANNDPYERIELLDLTEIEMLEMHPMLKLVMQDIKVTTSKANSLMSEKKPDFTVGYFIQSIKGPQESDGIVTNYDGTPRFQGANLGVSVPLFGKGYNANIKAVEIEKLVYEAQYNQQLKQVESYLESTSNRIKTLQTNLNYYEESGLEQASLIGSNSQVSYQRGNISYLEYVQALTTKNEVEQAYLDTLYEYNQLVNQLLYLQNKYK